MKPQLIDAAEVEANFDAVLARVEQGEEFLIVRNGKSIARFFREPPPEDVPSQAKPEPDGA